MNKEKIIGVLLSTKEIVNCTVRYADTSPWKMSLDCENIGVLQSKGEDLFEAFLDIRKQLRSDGVVLLCNGSRRNVFPSPMLRQSCGGKKVYLLRLGVPARFC